MAVLLSGSWQVHSLLTDLVTFSGVRVPVTTEVGTRRVALRRVIERLHFPLEIMLAHVRLYAAYWLSLRSLEEMLAERGVPADHATVHRWALKLLPVLAAAFRRRLLPVGSSWHLDETCVLVGGQRKHLCRAVDKHGQTVDLLLTARYDEAAARRDSARAVNLHDLPSSIRRDKIGANPAAVRSLIAGISAAGHPSRPATPSAAGASPARTAPLLLAAPSLQPSCAGWP